MGRVMKHICNKTICIDIDEELYRTQKPLLDIMFLNFSPDTISLDGDVQYIYIHSLDANNKYNHNVGHIVCDTHDPQWLFYLTCELEELFADTLNCTVLHGSCLRYREKGILILGERKSGKTTLTYNLLARRQVEYLDDDCVYYMNGNCYGLSLPMALRFIPEEKNETNTFIRIEDSEGKHRFLVSPANICSMLSSVDIIFFPKYSCAAENRIQRVEGQELFKHLLFNTRHSGSLFSVYNDICSLAKNTVAYKLEYSSSNEALLLVDQAFSELPNL